jgi:CBS domain-containing protein
MSVGRICCREVDLAAVDESALEAAQRMAARGVGSLLVLNQAQEPMGIITDRDFVLRVLAADKDPRSTRVGEVMTRDPKIVAEDCPIETALALMRAGSFRRLPVVDHHGALVGILSLDDVLTLLAEEFAHIGSVLERRRS